MKYVRPHGTKTKYVHDKCRCELCKKANLDYENARAAKWREQNPWRIAFVPRKRLYVVVNRFTNEIVYRIDDKTRARERAEKFNREHRATCIPLWAPPEMLRAVQTHIERLLAQEVSVKQMSLVCGVKSDRIWEIQAGEGKRPNRPKRLRVRYDTCTRIQSVQPEHVALGGQIDGKDTRRMIQEIRKLGLPKYRIDALIGNSGHGLQVAKREKVRNFTYLRVKKLHDQLRQSNPDMGGICRCPDWAP